MSADYRQYPFSKGIHPTGWVETTVGDVVLEIRSGYSSGKHNQMGQGIPHLRPMNVSSVGDISMKDVRYVSPDIGSVRLAKNDVLFTNTSSTAWVGKTAHVDKLGDWGFSNHMTRLRVAGGISPEFVARQLHYLCISGYFAFHCKRHINQSSVGRKQLSESVPFRLPPTNEQQRIASKLRRLLVRERRLRQDLDTLPAIMQQYRAAVLEAACTGSLVPTEAELARKEHRHFEPASALLKQILRERRTKWESNQLAKMCALGKEPKTDNWKARYLLPSKPATTHRLRLPKGWVWASVEQCSCLMQYGTSSKTNSQSDGIPVLRMGNIVNGSLQFDDLRYLPKSHSEFPDLFLKRGDVLFNRTNSAELVGKTAVFQQEGRFSYASYLIRLRFIDGCMPEFISFFINSLFGRDWVASVAGQVTGQANVSGAKLAALTFPLPPIAEQRRIVAEVQRRLATLTHIEEQIKIALEQASQLRISLFHRALSGKFVKQNPNDEPAKKLLKQIHIEREIQLARPKPRNLNRKPKMKKLSTTFVKEAILKLPKDRFTFDDLNAVVLADYDSLKDIIFALLDEAKPSLKQVFDFKAKEMRFQRIKV